MREKIVTHIQWKTVMKKEIEEETWLMEELNIILHHFSPKFEILQENWI